jgi:hypothetical protein
MPFARRAEVAQKSSQVRALLASMHEEMADRARTNGDSGVARHLALLAQSDSKLAQFYAGRAQLYHTESRIGRCLQFSKMLHGGVYRGVETASAGFRYAMKDLAFVLGGPGVPQLLAATLHRLRRNLTT